MKELIRRMLKYDECDRITWDEIFKHAVLLKKYTVLCDGDDNLEENDKNNPIF